MRPLSFRPRVPRGGPGVPCRGSIAAGTWPAGSAQLLAARRLSGHMWSRGARLLAARRGAVRGGSRGRLAARRVSGSRGPRRFPSSPGTHSVAGRVNGSATSRLRRSAVRSFRGSRFLRNRCLAQRRFRPMAEPLLRPARRRGVDLSGIAHRRVRTTRARPATRREATGLDATGRDWTARTNGGAL